MSFELTKTMQAASAGYGLYCLAKPSHLASALREPRNQRALDRLARTFAVRDIPIAALALAGPPAALPWAVGGRVASDVGDALVLGASTKGSIRTKVLAVTLGWATLNALAYAADTRRR